MSEQLQVYEAHQALAKSVRGNYEVTSPLTSQTAKLTRDVDFGVIQGTKQPSLYKAGAEKICMAYGLMQHYTLETKIEQVGDADHDPVFFYTVKCELVKVSNDGKEYVFSSGYGSSNTKERRNGRNGAFDSANATLKMAEKRSLVDATLHVSGLSSMFSQDMENEDFVNKGYSDMVQTSKDDAPLTVKQQKHIFALGADNGYSSEDIKQIFKENGFAGTKDITQKDYDKVLSLINTPKENK